MGQNSWRRLAEEKNSMTTFNERNLNEEQFFHGTAGYDYPPGHKLTVEEANKQRNFDVSDPGHLYFTSSKAGAAAYAQHHYNVQFGAEPVVYHVRPTGPHEPDSFSVVPTSSRQTKHPLEIVRKLDPDEY